QHNGTVPITGPREDTMAVSFDFSRQVPPPEPSRTQLRIAGTDAAREDRLAVTSESVYVWDYEIKRPDLRNLFEKAKDAQWNAKAYASAPPGTPAIAWDTPVDPEGDNVPEQFIPIFGTRLWDKLDKKTELPRLRRHSTAYVLSNFLHGEQGALLTTAQLV